MEATASIRPLCECNRKGCSERLPASAYAVAGGGSEELYAIHPDHLDDKDDVVVEGKGWLGVREAAA